MVYKKIKAHNIDFANWPGANHSLNGTPVLTNETWGPSAVPVYRLTIDLGMGPNSSSKTIPWQAPIGMRLIIGVAGGAYKSGASPSYRPLPISPSNSGAIVGTVALTSPTVVTWVTLYDAREEHGFLEIKYIS
jgi:hypothetical protein